MSELHTLVLSSSCYDSGYFVATYMYLELKSVFLKVLHQDLLFMVFLGSNICTCVHVFLSH